jgi:hypothetical protein
MLGVSMVDTELAWELADTARRHLNAPQRNAVYVGIASGEALWAVSFLLQTIVRAGLAVRADLAPKLLRWVASYEAHPKQAHLRDLIGHVRIQPSSSVTIAPQRPAMATLSGRRPGLVPIERVTTSYGARR